jgi:hypothetical protein
MPGTDRKRPLDPNELAHQLVKEATEDEQDDDAREAPESAQPDSESD